jgi:hypothetical protein
MAIQIFRVDLSEKARDFQATATEPGLAMLDRQNANYDILRQWFGTSIAEPEWRGELVNFYANEEEGGRLDDVYVYPCTKKDLEGTLEDQVEDLESRMKRARPETANEELLLKIVRDQFKTLTADLDHSDFDCHFFKYRLPGSPWKLVWCWGYQRTDLQPCPALICHNPDCNILFVRRPDTKNRCPRCQAVVDRKRRRGVWGTIRRNLIPIGIALLLLLLLLAWFGKPKLVVQPGNWRGPSGSRAEFKVYDTWWFIFRSDVTANVLPQSNDTRVIEFDKYGCAATAGAVGFSTLTFRYEDRVTSFVAEVTQANPPDSLAIELNPDKSVLGIGSTAKVTVWGEYKDGSPRVDFTHAVSFENSDEQVLVRRGPRVEGVGVGTATLTASMTGKDDKKVADSAEFTVKDVDYQTVEVSVDPDKIPLGSSGTIWIDALDAEGERFCMVGSSLRVLSVDPYEKAEVDEVDSDDILVGRELGAGTLTATVRKKTENISGSCPFEVTEGLLADGLNGPDKVLVRVYEQLDVDIMSSGILPFEGASEDPQIAEALTGDTARVVGRSVGTTNVTFTQGTDTIKIAVEVVAANVTGLRIEPSEINLAVGEPRMIRVLAVADSGEFDVAPDSIEWLLQPAPQYVDFNRDLMEMVGLAPTTDSQGQPDPQDLAVKMDDYRASAPVTVSGDPLSSMLAEGTFGAYPPVNTAGIGGNIGLGDYGTGALVDGGLRIGDAIGTIPAGSRIVGVGDTMFDGMTAGQIRDYLGANPLVGGAGVRYIGPDGLLSTGQLPMTEAQIAAARMGAVVTNAQAGRSASGGLRATITVQVHRAAAYRVVDGSGATELSTYINIPDGGQATIDIADIPGAPAAGEIELNIERNMNGQTRLIPFTIEVGP